MADTEEARDLASHSLELTDELYYSDDSFTGSRGYSRDRSGSVGNLPKLEETGQGSLDAAAQVSPAASAGINAGFLAPQAPTIPEATLPDPDQAALQRPSRGSSLAYDSGLYAWLRSFMSSGPLESPEAVPSSPSHRQSFTPLSDSLPWPHPGLEPAPATEDTFELSCTQLDPEARQIGTHLHPSEPLNPTPSQLHAVLHAEGSDKEAHFPQAQEAIETADNCVVELPQEPFAPLYSLKADSAMPGPMTQTLIFNGLNTSQLASHIMPTPEKPAKQPSTMAFLSPQSSSEAAGAQHTVSEEPAGVAGYVSSAIDSIKQATGMGGPAEAVPAVPADQKVVTLADLPQSGVVQAHDGKAEIKAVPPTTAGGGFSALKTSLSGIAVSFNSLFTPRVPSSISQPSEAEEAKATDAPLRVKTVADINTEKTAPPPTESHLSGAQTHAVANDELAATPPPAGPAGPAAAMTKAAEPAGNENGKPSMVASIAEKKTEDGSGKEKKILDEAKEVDVAGKEGCCGCVIS